jgi:hypothetical protein
MSDAKVVEAIDAGADEFWRSFLRPILLIGVVVGAAGALLGLALLFRFNDMVANAKMVGQHWPALLFFNYAIEIGLPLCLIIGSIAGLKQKPRARLILLIYAWIDIAFAAFSIGSALWNLPRFSQSMIFVALINSIDHAVVRAAFPAVLLILLYRKPIAALFVQRGAGFDVMPPTD